MECFGGLQEVDCGEIAKANAYRRGDDGLLVAEHCPNETACLLRREHYEQADLNMPEYFAYLKALLAAEMMERLL